MDLEERARRQSRRVIISEIIMVVAVIATVLILALIVSGYWVNSDLQVERQGMLQISSIPTGANVEVDGSTSWLQRTNTSKVLTAGEHTIKLTKDGYDSWSRTVNISEGLLYRIHYPRLFLNNRSVETAMPLPNYTFITTTPDNNTLLTMDSSSVWQITDLTKDKLTPKPLTIAVDNEGSPVLAGQVLYNTWAHDNEHLLLKTEKDSRITWLLINIKNPSNSINLTDEFQLDIDTAIIINDSASNLLATSSGTLYKVDLASKQLSTPLATKVTDYAYHNSNVIFAARHETDAASATTDIVDGQSQGDYYVGVVKIGDDTVKNITDTNLSAKVGMIKFYEDVYYVISEENNIKLINGEDLSEFYTKDISFTPSQMKIAMSGEFIVFSNDDKIATLDMEAMQVTEWTTGTADYHWLDDNMVYSINDGALKVYDFDGLNERTLATDVSVKCPVIITEDKWLYFERSHQLVREWLIEK